MKPKAENAHIFNGSLGYLELLEHRLTSRLARIRLGLLGDCKSIQGVKGIYELRIHLESGYRIYFGKQGDKIILLLIGGDKSSQKKDIEKAYDYWQDYLNSNKGE